MEATEKSATENLVADSEQSTDPTTPADAAIAESYASRRQFDRLSIPFAARLPLLTVVSGLSGMMLGLAHGGQEAGLRFRAEHAHKLPNSTAGWYLYHKSKNYHVMLGGIVEGLKMGRRVAFWTCVFTGMEEGVDRGRAAVRRAWRRNSRVTQDLIGNEEFVASNRDFASTMFAGLGTAGLFSAWNGFPMATAVRMAKLGAKAGLAFGVAQDIVSLLRGRRLGYVEFIKAKTVGIRDVDDARNPKAAAAP